MASAAFLANGLQLTPLAVCPIPAGKAGPWCKLADGLGYWRKADGSDVSMGGGGGGAGGFAIFGDGSDGAAAFDGANPVTGATLVGAIYTLDRDVFYSSLAVDAGVSVVWSGFRIFCSGTATVAVGGVIRGDGGTAIDFNAGLGAPEGALRGGVNGGSGGGGDGDAGVASVYGAGGVGGAGGAGIAGAAGAGGGVTPPLAAYGGIREMHNATSGTMSGIGIAGVAYWFGGAGGGGGGGNSVDNGGGGGGGGGVGILVARAIVNDGTIRANGGGGADGPAIGDGGGGGGGGGALVMVYGSKSGAGTYVAAGGAKGVGNAGGLDGVDGSAGVVIEFQN